MSVQTELKTRDIAAAKAVAPKAASLQTNHGQTNHGQSSRGKSTSDALAMRLSHTDLSTAAQRDLPDIPTHVVRLSREGLRFDHTEQLEQSQRLWLQLRLNQRQVAVAAEVIVCDCKKDHYGKKRFDTQLRFVGTSTDFLSMVQAHIDDVISKIHRNRVEYTYVPGGLTHTAA